MIEVKSFEPLYHYLKATSKKWQRQVLQLAQAGRNALGQRFAHSTQAWWPWHYALEVVPIKTNHPYGQRFKRVRNNGFNHPAG